MVRICIEPVMIYQYTKQDLLEWRLAEGVTSDYLLDVVAKGKPVDSSYVETIAGSVLKSCLLMPEQINDLYAPYSGQIPTQKMAEVLEHAIVYLIGKGRLTHDIMQHKDVILNQCNFQDYDQYKKPDTLWKSIVEKSEKWWEFTVDCLGQQKIVVSPEEISLADRAAEMAKESKVSRPYIVPLEGRDYHFSKPVLFEHSGVECKTVLDIVIVAPARKKVVLVSVKTPFDTDTDSLAIQIKKGHYATKMSFDHAALESITEEIGATGFTTECCFLFVPKNVKGGQEAFMPVVWPCTENMLYWAKYGGQVYGSRTYKFAGENTGSHYAVAEHKGWADLLQWYQYCKVEKRHTFKTRTRLLTKEQADSLFFS